MPLDFFLESGDGGDIGNGLVPWEPFDRDVPAKFRCSAVSFSVSAKVGALALRLRSQVSQQRTQHTQTNGENTGVTK